MPLPRWLRSLLPHKPSQTGAPPPPSGEGWGGGRPPTIPTPPTPDPSPLGGRGVPNSPDNSHRIHIAANDPAFAAKREAAVALICDSITAIASPMGYTQKGTTWARKTEFGTSAVHLQRSSYGFTASLHLRFLTPDGTAPETGIWSQDEDIRINRFVVNYPDDSQNADITYLDIIENPASLDPLMQTLATRALPWLDAHHTATHSPDMIEYLPD